MASTVASNTTADTPNGSVSATPREISEERDAENFISKTNWEFMRQAFFHTCLLIFAICCVLSAVGAYYLFYEFVKPLMWAVICGITLYPLKKKLTQNVKLWLDGLILTRTPLAVALITCPVKIFDRLGDFLIETFYANRPLVLGLVGTFPALSLLLYCEIVPKTVNLFLGITSLIDRMVFILATKIWVFGLILFFFYMYTSSTYYTKVQPSQRTSQGISCILWIGCFIYICNFFGPFRAPLFFAIICTFISYILLRHRKIEPASEREKSRRASFSSEISEHWEENELEEENEDPNRYLKWLTIACAFVYVSQRLWLTLLLVIPLLFGIFKRTNQRFDLARKASVHTSKLHDNTVFELMFPGFLKHFGLLLFKIDKKTILFLRSSMDLVGSLAAICLLSLSVLCISGFVTVQLYYESLHLIQLTTQLANQTFVNSLQFQQWLHNTAKFQNITQLTDYVTENAYTAAKSYLSDQITSMCDGNESKAAQLEHHLVKSFAALYNTVIVSNVTMEVADATDSWSDLWSIFTWSNTEIFESIASVLEENIHTWWSLGESVIGILWNSSELIFGSLTGMFSIVFESGSAVLDFVLDMIVFLTFLFTLLCGSDEEFMPMKFVRDNLPNTKGRGAEMVAQVEQAVSGVFLATLKMATFYGMLAWLTHTIFAVQLVFVPSVLASIFAAIPFLGTYFAAFPAVLELWLVRGEPFQAVLLFLIHLIPGYFVDDTIYSEIKSTNPFLTGMAIAGGMCWWGLEGAIFGPIILCVFIVMGRLYRMLIEEQENVPKSESIRKSSQFLRRQSNVTSGNNSDSKTKRFSKYTYQLDFAPYQVPTRRWSVALAEEK